jgi:hypothetical protein
VAASAGAGFAEAFLGNGLLALLDVTVRDLAVEQARDPDGGDQNYQGGFIAAWMVLR